MFKDNFLFTLRKYYTTARLFHFAVWVLDRGGRADAVPAVTEALRGPGGRDLNRIACI